MADNSQKTPLVRNLNRFAKGKVLDQIQLEGKALPCKVESVSGAMVTVSFLVESLFTFQTVTVPQAISRYARPPTAPGDMGVVRAADAYMGGVSGLGGGVATLSQPANLSALVFEPVSNAGWAPTPNPAAYCITAPQGVVLQDDAGDSVVVINNGTIAITGVLMINGRPYLSHDHTGVTTGIGTTGPVGP